MHEVEEIGEQKEREREKEAAPASPSLLPPFFPDVSIEVMNVSEHRLSLSQPPPFFFTSLRGERTRIQGQSRTH